MCSAALADIRVPIYAMNARQVENNCAVISLTIGINNTEHLNRGRGPVCPKSRMCSR